MSVKEEVLKELEENRGNYFSGEALARKLNKSRAAIWKAINQLKSEGYMIEAVNNKGYSLNICTDVISKEGIKAHLKEEYKENEIKVYKTIGSTNEEAKKEAMDGGCAGTVIISEGQTDGKGRRGRSFFSPSGSGIYMSIILRPDMEITEAAFITTAASVAVAEAIENVTGIKAGIKWVNDIFIDGKKAAGILTEAVTDFETGRVEWVILGIGVNFSTCIDDYPDEIKDTAVSIFSGKQNRVTRNELAAEIINKVMTLCTKPCKIDFAREYKKRSVVLGKRIAVIKKDRLENAKALDIDGRGGLVVEYDDGRREILRSGEVTLRIKE